MFWANVGFSGRMAPFLPGWGMDKSSESLRAKEHLLEPKNDAVETLHTVQDWIRWGASSFERGDLYYGHGTDNAWDDAAQLILWLVKTPWAKLDAILAARLTVQEREHAYQLIHERLITRKPAAYLTGEAYFAGLPFIVNEQVLVPRSPIAQLIEQQFQPWLEQSPKTVLDMCTGSGCIGIACAVAFPEAFVDLVDISAGALEVAEQNVVAYGLEQAVSLIESDGLQNVDNAYDLIVCNPPYVDAEDMAALPQEYCNEPELALASGPDGLDFTRQFLQNVNHRLKPGGVIVLEVGNSWEALEEAFPTVPFTWVDLPEGGHGVCVLTKAQLEAYKEV